jgi:hypothetical protein
MFGSAILDVAIGLVTVYCFVSLICTAVREGIEGFLKTRAAYLERGIRELLHDRGAAGLVRAVYEHPLIAGLYTGEVKPADARNWIPEFFKGKGLPSYIPARTFATALLDIAARGPRTDETAGHPTSAPLSVASIRANVLAIQNPAVQRVLLGAVDTAQGDIERVRTAIEDWYNTAMDRVSGWYKRSTHFVILLIALIVAAAFNVDTVQIARSLYEDKALRDAVVAQASAVSEAGAANFASYESATEALDGLGLPIGWTQAARDEIAADSWGLLMLVPGWLLTAFAASLGAPFWFDLLSKFTVIRSTVKPREKSQEEGSEDRPTSRSTPAGASTPLAPPLAPAAAAAPPMAAAPAPVSHDDSCGAPDGAPMADEDLPAARGG